MSAKKTTTTTRQQTLTGFFKPLAKDPKIPPKSPLPAKRSASTVQEEDLNDENEEKLFIGNGVRRVRKLNEVQDASKHGIGSAHGCDEGDDMALDDLSIEPISVEREVKENEKHTRKKTKNAEILSAFFTQPTSIVEQNISYPKKAASSAISKFAYNEGRTKSAAEMALGPEIEENEKAEQKRKRHEAFVQKFGDQMGTTATIARKNFPKNMEEKQDHMDLDETQQDEAGEDSNSLEMSIENLRAKFSSEGASSKATTTGTTKKKKDKQIGDKYTPLERQYVELKAQYPDTLLMIEVGYKFKFFDEDARIASRLLSIAHFLDHNFHVAMVPVHRLNVHVRRLVHAGLKVGIVRQTETAALKAVGDNRNTPFTRQLTNLYTKATFVDELTSAEIMEDEIRSSSLGADQYLMCIVEKPHSGSGKDECVYIAIVAVQPATGDIIYDSFEDKYLRSELETRLLHIQPCEILLPENLSKSTEKLINQLARHRTTAFGDAIRVERSQEVFGDYNNAFTFVTEFYAKACCKKEEIGEVMDTNDRKETFFAEILRFPENVIMALAALIRHLTAFGLEHIFNLTKYFQPFGSRAHMLLNGNTLVSLEIFRNQTNHTEYGSLFWVLNHTRTTFGRRLLKKWIGRPLVDVGQLQKRVDAVEEILQGKNELLTKASELRRQLPDLEKGLCRIHYGKSSPSELLQILNALHHVAVAFPRSTASGQFASSILNDIFAFLPTVLEDVERIRSFVNPNTAEKDDKINLFLDSEEKQGGRYPKIGEIKGELACVEQELMEHLKEVRRMLKKPSLQYTHQAQFEYLIEIKNSETKIIPKNWIKQNSTKALSRYHTPTVVQKLKVKAQFMEKLILECESAYKDFLSYISEKYELFRDLIQNLAVLDCLFSFAAVALQPGYVKPEYTDRTQISVVNGRHPMVEHILGGQFVPNDIELDVEKRRTIILTGPNMGGKSSYIRQVALISIMGQIGSYVPADSAKLGMLDAVHTRMGAFDNMLAGESTFMVELHETADIIRQATPRSLVILDELGRGTSTHDGVAIAYAVLRHFITNLKAITLFVTHYPSLSKLANEFPGSTVNCHMGFLETQNEDGSSHVTFLYKLTEGVAMRSYGLNVARLANLPNSVIETARVKSAEMELNMVRKERIKRAGLLREAIKKLFGRGEPPELTEKTVDFLKLAISGVNVTLV